MSCDKLLVSKKLAIPGANGLWHMSSKCRCFRLCVNFAAPAALRTNLDPKDIDSMK